MVNGSPSMRIVRPSTLGFPPNLSLPEAISQCSHARSVGTSSAAFHQAANYRPHTERTVTIAAQRKRADRLRRVLQHHCRERRLKSADAIEQRFVAKILQQRTRQIPDIPLLARAPIWISRCGSCTGSGLKSNASSRLKIAVFAPSPSARERMAAKVNAGVRESCRRLATISLPNTVPILQPEPPDILEMEQAIVCLRIPLRSMKLPAALVSFAFLGLLVSSSCQFDNSSARADARNGHSSGPRLH